MFDIRFEVSDNIAMLDGRIKEAIVAKLLELTDLAFRKVEENLSGAVLQKQSGQLLGSLRKEVNIGETESIGRIFLDVDTPKAIALEKGGERYYPIVPTKADVLVWISKGGEKVFASSVIHPPSKAFRYFGLAAGEMTDLVPEGFQQALQEAIDGKSL